MQSALCSHCVHIVFVVDREVLVANAGALEERDAAERRRCQRKGAWPDCTGQCRIASRQYHRREPEQQSPEERSQHAEQSSEPCAHKVAKVQMRATKAQRWLARCLTIDCRC